MREFPGALTEDKIDHNSDTFKLIQERNAYLWKFVRAIIPGASGRLHDYVDLALMRLSDSHRQTEQLRVEVENVIGMAHSFANFPSWLEQLEEALAAGQEDN